MVGMAKSIPSHARPGGKGFGLEKKFEDRIDIGERIARGGVGKLVSCRL